MDWSSRGSTTRQKPAAGRRSRVLFAGGMLTLATLLSSCGLADQGDFGRPTQSTISAEDAEYCEPGNDDVERLDFVQTAVLRNPETQNPEAVATVGGRFCGDMAFRGWIAVVAGPGVSPTSEFVVSLSSPGEGMFKLGNFPATTTTAVPVELAGTFQPDRPSTIPGSSGHEHIVSVDLVADARPGQNIGEPPPDDTHQTAQPPQGSGFYVEGTAGADVSRARKWVRDTANGAARKLGVSR